MVKKIAKKPAKKAAAHKTASSPARVDYYPNRMTVAVAALAVTILVLLALIASYGVYRGW